MQLMKLQLIGKFLSKTEVPKYLEIVKMARR
jgi:hypothetical protein